MTSIWKNILPLSPSKTRIVDENNNDYSVEYSFALEYNGPPVNYYDIPKAVPFDFDQIPIASIVSNDSVEQSNLLSLPVIDPIVKTDPLSKKFSGEFRLCYKSIVPKNIHEEEEIPKFSDRITCSGSIEFSDSDHDNSQVVDEELNDELEDGFNSDDVSSVVYPLEEVEKSPYHVKRPSIVTFHDPEPTQGSVVFQRKLVIRTNLRKGSCYRCLKRNRFSDKEVCIVCGAKFCGNCVIRAMGSMPEGRKCVTCIGYTINESKRGLLGKSSRLLRQLLTYEEIKSVMQCEMFCEANRLHPSLVYVNGNPLSCEEFVQLQSCLHPPKTMKPGRYWYDRMSGFWGNEGHKPCQIISAALMFSGEISRKASNGNTNVLINHREITKPELRMLKRVGIRCEGCLHFWLDAEGTLQEEGMNKVRAKNIWEKKRINLVCALLSLPIPPKSSSSTGEKASNRANGVVKNEPEQEVLHKLLLVGSDQSGTSTIFKQARMVHKVRFTEDEREMIKSMIRTNLYNYLGTLLEQHEQFEEESVDFSLSPRLRAFSEWLVQVMVTGNLEVIFPASSREYAPRVEELVKDRAFQATYNRINELHMLPCVAKYFLERAVEISRIDYEPSDIDILYADGITSSNGLACMEFSFPEPSCDNFAQSAEEKDMRERKFQLIRVHSSTLGENCKWLEMFEDTDLVLFCVSLTAYDEFFKDEHGVIKNKMLQSKKLFESIVAHPSYHHKNFLLLLTKFDLLEEKIEQSPLTICEWFDDFDPVISRNPNSGTSVYANTPLAYRAFQYIGMRFKRLFQSLTGRKLYVSMVIGLQPDSVDRVLKYAKEIIKWDEEKPRFSAHEWSSGSIEASSTS